MIPFEMVEPTSLNEALSLLDPQEPTIRPVAGGTALMLMMKAGVFTPTRLICLHRIEPDFSRIALTDKGELRIGGKLNELGKDEIKIQGLKGEFATRREGVRTIWVCKHDTIYLRAAETGRIYKCENGVRHLYPNASSYEADGSPPFINLPRQVVETLPEGAAMAECVVM